MIGAEPFLTGTVTVALILFTVYQPYEDCIHNVGIIYNTAISAGFMGWNYAREFFPELTVENNEEISIMAVIGALFVCLVIAIVRIIVHSRSVLREGFCIDSKKSTYETIKAEHQKIINEEIC